MQFVDSVAMHDLATRYMAGSEWNNINDSAEQDYKKAAHLYFKAAEAGNEHSLYKLGCMYLELPDLGNLTEGMSKKERKEKGLECWLKAAQLEHTWAIEDIGSWYAASKNEEIYNEGEKIEWYKMAIESGDIKTICLSGFNLDIHPRWNLYKDLIAKPLNQ